MAKKQISKSDFDQLSSKIISLETSNDPLRDEKLFKLYDEWEQNLEFVGASAIEDKL